MDYMQHRRETITAGVFLTALLLGVVLWLWGYFAPADSVGMAPPTRAESLTDAFLNAEAIINDSMDRSHSFIQLHGGIQRLLGRRVVEDVDGENTVYKLSDGSLTFVRSTPCETLSDHADAYLSLQAVLEEKNIPLLYVQGPQKIGPEGSPTLPAGVADYGNQHADQFLALLSEGGVPTLDFRQTLLEDGDPWTSYFFVTDHHWTPDATQICTQELVDYLNANYGMELDPSLTDAAAFTTQVLKDSFLGSQGKRTGSLYAGLDDLTVWTPNYETSFTYSVPSQSTERKGAFEESLLFPERLEQTDLFQANPYTLYAGGDYVFARITNHNNPDGPKILLLRDSLSCTLAPFLALHCSELITVDPRHVLGNIAELIQTETPDLVISLYSPGAVANEVFFQFFGKPET